MASAKNEEYKKKAEKLLTLNRQCQIKLRSEMGLSSEDDYGMMYANATTYHFSKCTPDELKAFIHARQFDTPTISRNSKWKWPKKGKVDDANNGVECLIDLAFKRRSSPVVLTATQTPPAALFEAPRVPIEPTVVL